MSVQRPASASSTGRARANSDGSPPTIGVVELADSSVNFVVRPWCNSGDYWPLHFDLHETIKKRFDAEGISIPFPQQDVHMHQVA